MWVNIFMFTVRVREFDCCAKNFDVVHIIHRATVLVVLLLLLVFLTSLYSAIICPQSQHSATIVPNNVVAVMLSKQLPLVPKEVLIDVEPMRVVYSEGEQLVGIVPRHTQRQYLPLRIVVNTVDPVITYKCSILYSYGYPCILYTSTRTAVFRHVPYFPIPLA